MRERSMDATVRSGVTRLASTESSSCTSTKSFSFEAEAIVPAEGSPTPEHWFRRRCRLGVSPTLPFSRDHLKVGVMALPSAATLPVWISTR